MTDTQNVTFSNSGQVRAMIPLLSLNLKFLPDTVVFKQMNFNVTYPVVNGTLYFLWCSLVNNYIGVFYYNDGFLTIEPMTTFSISCLQDVSFRVDYGVPGNPLPSGVFADWSITLEFSRGKNAQYFISGE